MPKIFGLKSFYCLKYPPGFISVPNFQKTKLQNLSKVILPSVYREYSLQRIYRFIFRPIIGFSMDHICLVRE